LQTYSIGRSEKKDALALSLVRASGNDLVGFSRLFLLSTPFPDCDPVEAPGDRTFFLLRFVDEAISSLIGLQILSQSTRKSSVSGA
jgi:hypothetical protein